MILRRRTLLAASAATATTIASPAIAQNYPRRPVQLIVAFAAGGSTDVGARILAAAAEKDLGQTITVVNKGGAGGQIGFTEIARARPDGYTLGFLNLPAVNTIILDPERKAAFNVDSFIPIVNQVLDPGLIWVKGDSPYKSVADLIDAAKKEPGKIRACTTGILSDDHLAILMMQEAAKCEFRIVHFDSGTQQLAGVMGGHVDVAFDNVGSIVKRIESGEARGLAVTDVVRSKFLPNVPCTKELGYTTVISSSTRGVGAPKGTPADIVKVIETAFLKAINSADMKQKMDVAGLALKPMVGAEYAKYYADTQAQAKKYTEWALKMR
ncbi:MAG: tripartite tricarboxylate transporter substrate binding protein [Reyranella sp.]|uniref:tripartite tricarboxylate transporter substrate binding protein n=1 Tax=Reyranella sp. TaxID=1929291 RepID=UPI0011FF9C3A|nr:tripartite tricarboxylate transporter substrate binding protein [Reyranella sp.]TAJ38562.1 MAG: tripartite tricarboxylate transporter substrate binding protein [Reyranella sp.]